jgi:hypothetical protein
MLNAERRNDILSSYENGKKMGDMYFAIAPQEIRKRPMSWAKRVAYGLGAQDFHFDKKIALSVAFPDFNPIQLEDRATAMGYEMWLLTHNFHRDGLKNPTDEIVKRAKMGFKYSVAVTVVKDFKHTLREEQIPDPESRAFKYFREMLISDRDPVDIFSSILADPLFQSDEEAGKTLDACRRILRIKAEAGMSMKRFTQPADRYLSKDEIATIIDSLLGEAIGYAKAGAPIIV